MNIFKIALVMISGVGFGFGVDKIAETQEQTDATKKANDEAKTKRDEATKKELDALKKANDDKLAEEKRLRGC